MGEVAHAGKYTAGQDRQGSFPAPWVTVFPEGRRKVREDRKPPAKEVTQTAWKRNLETPGLDLRKNRWTLRNHQLSVWFLPGRTASP
jgi:hypothetical protein